MGQFIQFNPSELNQETDAEYLADPNRVSGFPAGAVVGSPVFNKIIYQPSTFCAAFGQMMATKGYTLDDSSLSTLAGVLGNILTDADIPPPIMAVPYSPTPAFNATLATGFQMTLHGNITSSTLSGQLNGQLLAFYFIQNSTGGYTVSWPSSFVGGIQPDPTPNSVSLLLFRVDLTGVPRAIGPLISNNGVFFGGNVNVDGILTAPTPSTNDNSTKTATTAWCFAGFAASIGLIGYLKFPAWLGGLLIQWGNTSNQYFQQGVSESSVAFTFPRAFTSQLFSIIGTPSTSPIPPEAYVFLTLTDGSLTGGTWTCSTGAGQNVSVNIFAYWIAVGI